MALLETHKALPRTEPLRAERVTSAANGASERGPSFRQTYCSKERRAVLVALLLIARSASPVVKKRHQADNGQKGDLLYVGQTEHPPCLRTFLLQSGYRSLPRHAHLKRRSLSPYSIWIPSQVALPFSWSMRILSACRASFTRSCMAMLRRSHLRRLEATDSTSKTSSRRRVSTSQSRTSRSRGKASSFEKKRTLSRMMAAMGRKPMLPSSVSEMTCGCCWWGGVSLRAGGLQILQI
mmetsp:Transcript_37047/g.92929  ORF Transcript_37047/g.92929 Transcript_37047/m.92929 type:complete len:237 (-) Transcript_37047:3639-4349(-)